MNEVKWGVTGLLQYVELSIQNRRLLQRGDRALVVVSGGLDSMVLLHVLHQLATGTGGD
ncbi:MAG: hypothetical protein ACLP2Y_17005 [Limisphaerales bacterium]